MNIEKVPLDGKFAIIYPRPKNDEEFWENLEELHTWYETYKDNVVLNSTRKDDLVLFADELAKIDQVFEEGNREGAYQMIYLVSKMRASLHNLEDHYFDTLPINFR